MFPATLTDQVLRNLVAELHRLVCTTPPVDTTTDPATIRQIIGQNLRDIRTSRGMSLQDVEMMSDHEFKASVLGAYERAERTISTARIVQIARLYQVDVARLYRGLSHPDAWGDPR